MKRYHYCFLTVLVYVAFGCGVMATPAYNPGVEEVVLKTENDPGDDRSGSAPVEAFLVRSTNTLYISLAFSVGTTTITVKNASGTVVYSDVVDATLVGFTQFTAPSTPGTYALEIQSANYYGIGLFTI